MNHTDSHGTAKNTKNNKDTEKNPQELYDKYIRKGDEAIISEDIVLAEKYYQYADHFLRLMNDPNHLENDFEVRYLASSHSVERLIAQALKGIAIEKAAKKEGFKKKEIEVLTTTKTAKPESDKAIKTGVSQGKQIAQTKELNGKKVADKKPKNRGEPCKAVYLQSKAPDSGGKKKS